MKMFHENMIWHDLKEIKIYTQNIPSNKKKQAKKTSSIILAILQYTYNYTQGLKRQNAYDAASILYSDMNWIKKRHLAKAIDEDENVIKPKIGNLYYIDYGNTFNGEIGYRHHGVCIGKSRNKILIVPTRSGADVFQNSYHPTNNPNGKIVYRQGLQSEGFIKDCVLLIDDIKYISPARIDKESGVIDKNAIKDIQLQVFKNEFPGIYGEMYKRDLKKQGIIDKQKQDIISLKNEINHLKQTINNIDKKNKKR